MNQVFKIIADGRKVGITTAPDIETARKQAIKAHTRSTASKEDLACDYISLSVVPMDAAKPVLSAFVSRLVERVKEVSNSRFIQPEEV